jgi:hypothetical protein
MSDGYENAQAQRNWIERLGAKIPGYRGFQDRELRRDVDKLQREHLSQELERLKGVARSKARAWTDAGKIGALGSFERLDRQVDGLAQAIRFADYGASGFFDVVKVRQEELDKLYQFDLSLVEGVQALGGDLAAIPTDGSSDPQPAVETALERVQGLADRWLGRKNVISGVVKTAR